MKKIIKTTISYIIIIGIILFSFTISHAGPFQDVSSTHWSYKAIRIIYSNAQIKGYPINKFKNNTPLTRYEVAQLIVVIFEDDRFDKDFSILKKLAKEYGDELALLGKKVELEEDDLKMLRLDQEGMRERLCHMGMGKIKVLQEGISRDYSHKKDKRKTTEVMLNKSHEKKSEIEIKD